ncbi:MAG: putative LPS assembly protein LptD, partial [Candidatus Neomarinimicrobiota bacterium]|nr:putative LPS assembly protein LptD [Candidatus Neomarinimicrobiota bacterium]
MHYIILILSIPLAIFAEDRLRLKRADVLENVVIDGQAVQYLTGNVVFEKGPMTINCTKAINIEKTGQGSMIGNVKVVNDNQSITCDSLHYDSPNDILHGFGNARVWDIDYDLLADTLVYYSNLDSGIARGNAELSQNNQIITSHSIYYAKHAGEDAVSYTAEGYVTILEDERKATCGLAIYNREDQTTWLKLDPHVNEKDQTISGSEIILRYKDDVMEHLYIPAQAHVTTLTKGLREITTSNNDTAATTRSEVQFIDDLTGSSLQGFFDAGQMDSLQVEGMATTLYHVFEDSIYQGKNIASGDTIIMSFDGNNLDHIVVSGGSRGEYTPDSVTATIDGQIIYSSKIIDYMVDQEQTDLHGNAKIHYTNMDLDAGFINVDWKSNMLNATPQSNLDSNFIYQKPTILEQGRDPMTGDEMTYNLTSKKGRVTKGRTSADDGFYTGSNIRNQDKETFYIDNSTYTTCDLEVPHFHFASDEMKMINDDKVIARPIVLYITNIPIIGLPFGIFPHKAGRRQSGWIMPGYGESSYRGQFLDGFGYYWAPNEFWDSKLTTSLADRQGLTLRLTNNYRKRYGFSGGIHLETKQHFLSSLAKQDRDLLELDQNVKSDYVVRWNHNQVMRNNQTFRVNAKYYSSGDYNQRTGLDVERRLNQQAISNATYSKRWKKSNNSISVNLSSKRDLMVDNKADSNSVFYQSPTTIGKQLVITTNTLPKMSFRHGQSKLFKTNAVNKKWYHNISWNYSANLNNRLENYYESIEDSSFEYIWDNSVRTTSKSAVTHSMSVTAPQKIFKYISLNPSIQLKSDWVDRTFLVDTKTGSFQPLEQQGFAHRTIFSSFNLGMNTKLYGLFPIKIGSIHSIRHVASPTIGYSYSPDYTKPLFGMDLGYFQEYTDSNGETAYFDRFSGTTAGSTPRQERQAMTFSLNNVFQAKKVDGDKEKKIDLFSWRMNTSYNFVADQFPLSNLSSSLRAKVTKKLNLDLRLSHDFYQYDSAIGQRINSLNLNDSGIPKPRLINARLSTGFKFEGNRLGVTKTEEDVKDTSIIVDNLDEPKFGNRSGGKNNVIPGGKLWSTSLSFSYSMNKANPSN